MKMKEKIRTLMKAGVMRRCLIPVFLLWAVGSFAGIVTENVEQRPGKSRFVDVYLANVEVGAPIVLTAQDMTTRKNLPVQTLTLDDKPFTNGVSTATGDRVHLVWEVAADVDKSVKLATVHVAAEQTSYLVVDLSGGTSAENYPVSYLSTVPEGGWTDEYKTTKLVLRQIPNGRFMMGSPSTEKGRTAANEYRHEVTVSKPFCVGVFEITQRQWELVMGDKPGFFANETCYASRPVEQVTYESIRGALAAGGPDTRVVGAESFMGLLRAKTGLATFDLPTEAQWEYACRAGTTNALNSGVDLEGTTTCANLNEVGRYRQNGGSTGYNDKTCTTEEGTAAVGSYRPNAWGLYDMHGNVCEFCLDGWLAYLGTAAVVDPLNISTRKQCVSRGGGLNSYAQACRSASRLSVSGPTAKSRDLGLRLACAAAIPATDPGAVFSLNLRTEAEEIEARDYVVYLEGRAQQRYPWNGLVDIEVVVHGVSGEVPLTIAVTNATRVFNVKSLTLDGKPFNNGVQALPRGVYNFVWDADADVEPDAMASDLLVAATTTLVWPLPSIEQSWLVIDLTQEGFPFHFIESIPGGEDEWPEEYKTDKIVLRKLSAGQFTMGSPEDELGRYTDRWETLRSVTLTRGFWIGVFEMTQAQWLKVMDWNPSNNNVGNNTYPVEEVNPARIFDADGFATTLIPPTGLSLTLPTEAQWEYACRAGTTTAFNNGKNLAATYNAANGTDPSMNALGRYYKNGGSTSRTAKVGSYDPNAWGLYDMHGNVLEWCLDAYGEITSDPVTDPYVQTSSYDPYNTGKTFYALRGGCWAYNAEFCRSAAREYGSWSGLDATGWRGFRLANVPDTPFEGPRFFLDLRDPVRYTDKPETIVRTWPEIKTNTVEVFAVPVSATTNDVTISDIVEYGSWQRIFFFDANNDAPITDTYAAEYLFPWANITNATGLIKLIQVVTDPLDGTTTNLLETAYFHLPEVGYEVIQRDPLANGGSEPIVQVEGIAANYQSNRLDKTLFKRNIEADLNFFESNGLRFWENLVTDTPNTHFIKTHATVGDATTLTVGVSEGGHTKVASTTNGYDVVHVLRRYDLTDHLWKPVGDVQSSLGFDVPLASGYYRVSTLILPRSNAAITNEIVSSNIVGVLEVRSDMTNTLTAVPWRAMEDAPHVATPGSATVSDIVDPMHLSLNDLVVATAADGAFLSWKWTGTDWTSATTVRLTEDGAMETATAGLPEATTFERHDGVWVTRGDPAAGSYFLIGNYDSTPITVTVAGGTDVVGGDTCSFVMNPNLTDIAVNDYAWGEHPSSKDLISIPNGNNGRMLLRWRTTTTDGVTTGTWGQWVFDKAAFKSTWKDDYAIKAGTGFWYHRTGSEFTIPLPQDGPGKGEE